MEKKMINTIDDLEIGTIFRCSWNGMADYFQLLAKTPKSVKLIEIDWETCAPPDGEENDDPTYRWTRIKRDENGKAIPYVDSITGKTNICIKRIINLPKGGITFKSPNYSGDAHVSIATNDYMQMYWG